MAGVVIIGAGQGGFQCCESLREEGYEGDITLLGDESRLPYQRPPLSKDYLLGKTSAERLLYRPSAFYEQKRIEVKLQTRVVSIDPAGRKLQLQSGDVLAYEHLVLATGARVRKLPVEGADLQGVCYLRTLDDIDEIGARLERAMRVLVIGAGFIGLEFAAVARTLEKDVTVLEAAGRVMERSVQRELSQFFQKLHETHGVNVLCNAGVSEITGDKGQLIGVKTVNGQDIPADLVVAGIGVIPNTELAIEAGIECDNGIVVDETGRTSTPHVYALGDCTSFAHPSAGLRVRLESVQNAGDQARGVAATIAGHDKPYRAVPWFWSDQYDVKLQIAGLTRGCDRHVVRGEIETGRFSLLHFKGETFRAVEAINMPRDYIVGRKLLEQGVSPSLAQAEDPEFNLKSLLS